ncbi:uncharacterized protein LOC116512931 isoform X3 [Thamnophis elegans]|uniref:uncharacterized protein LOC116512931 isoform X3 n=1 Tax=Thamnophis elegans TaxID=35005 RepID=UPI001377D969|nr:uncharacterized protein LOC116512931 isoform X3 [Thamnophis elegans]
MYRRAFVGLRATAVSWLWTGNSCTCSRRCSSEPGTSEPRSVRIGCASGFWGDTAAAVPQLLYGGKLDFLIFDYLSEITMSLLARAKAKSPDLGYIPDFVSVAMAPYIKDIRRKGVRVISNAGGMNPLGCAAALHQVARNANVDLKIAVITGDDLMGELNNIRNTIIKQENGKLFPENVQSMNVYLGATPISRALDQGADIVVIGRCVDSSLALGPLLHSFGWTRDEFSLLAAGSLAGHLIECGAQCTGGIFTDWHTVPNWHNIGFPIIEASSDGSFIVSKAPDTGGLVTFGTVAEQLVYEIDNPKEYLLPDVTCDFSQVSLTEIAGIDGGAVKVQGAKGLPPSSFYKVNATYLDGFRATACCPMGGPKAIEKGKRMAESILERTRIMFHQRGYEDYSAVNLQILGSEETYGPHAKQNIDGGPREVVIWLAVFHKQKEALEIFSREIAPAGTGMGVIARHPLYYPYLKKTLTALAVENYFQHLLEREQPEEILVSRYDLPGIYGLNFVLKNSLGGGGTASLRSDPQGKAFGQMLLDFKIKHVPDLKSLIE